MEIAFKFNSGETPQQIVAAITGFFGVVNQGSHVVNVITAPGGSVGVAASGSAGTASEDEPGTAANPSTIDATGIPYDARIHSDPPQMTTKNVWRKKRGVADTLVASVTAELKAKAASVAQPAAAPIAPPALTAPAPLAAPAALTPPAPLVKDAFTNFVEFLASNTAPAGRLTPDYITQSLAAWGFKDSSGAGSVNVLQHSPTEQLAQIAKAFADALGVPAPTL